jgi:hypothetical protein
MSKKPISPKGNYEIPDCLVTKVLTGRFFCSSIESLDYEDYDSSFTL